MVGVLDPDPSSLPGEVGRGPLEQDEATDYEYAEGISFEDVEIADARTWIIACGFDGSDDALEGAARDVADEDSPYFQDIGSAAAHWGLWT